MAADLQQAQAVQVELHFLLRDGGALVRGVQRRLHVRGRLLAGPALFPAAEVSQKGLGLLRAQLAVVVGVDLREEGGQRRVLLRRRMRGAQRAGQRHAGQHDQRQAAHRGRRWRGRQQHIDGSGGALDGESAQAQLDDTAPLLL